MPHIIGTLNLIITLIFQSNGVSLRQQLEHIAKTRIESRGLLKDIAPSRRYVFDPRELSQILGSPNRPSHLPEAEAILPGHTLNRPALGMLKSSLKFPHKELEDGAGVYGAIENLGIKYDSRNERVLNTGFRRFPSDFIMVIPSKSENKNPSFKLKSTVLDLERKDKAKKRLLDIIKKLNNSSTKGSVRIYVGDLNKNFLNNYNVPKTIDMSYYLNDDVANMYKEKSALRNANIEDEQPRPKNTSSSSEQEFDLSDTEKARAKKLHWLYSTKDSYNHIKINQDAPELNELVPPRDENAIQQWWFYSADDNKEFL